MNSGPAGLEWLIQRWVRLTGRAVPLADAPWLGGPLGDGGKIGAEFYARYAEAEGMTVAVNQPDSGLLPDFAALAGPTFAPERVAQAVTDFYERTVCYTLDAWSQWTGPMKPFAHLLIGLVSREIEQFNIPLAPLETSQGVSSDILRLTDTTTGHIRYTGWLRRAAATGRIIFAGFYTTGRPPNAAGECVKVVFPLPGGAVIVLLRPTNRPDGSLELVSAGKGFGDAGYYRVHRQNAHTLRVKYIPLKESIHVFQDAQGVLRTDHKFQFWGLPFLTLHYKIRRDNAR